MGLGVAEVRVDLQGRPPAGPYFGEHGQLKEVGVKGGRAGIVGTEDGEMVEGGDGGLLSQGRAGGNGEWGMGDGAAFLLRGAGR